MEPHVVGLETTADELTFQAERAAKIDVAATPEYIFERYRRCRFWRLFQKEYLFKQLWRRGAFSGGKRVLDFGCGEGNVTTELAKLGCHATGIDVSGELVALARRRARLDGVSDSVKLLVGDISAAQGPFDFVICNEVLHHVSIPEVFPRLMAVLKPGGTVAIAEPIAFSPALQAIRDRVPVEKDASPDERQLNEEDIAFVRRWLVDVETAYFNLFARFDRFFPNTNKIDKGHLATKTAVIAIHSVDRAMVAFLPSLRKFYGQIVIVGTRGAT